MRNPIIATFVVSLGLAAGCGPAFDPASEVQGLRVLAIRAEPPEIAPVSDGSAPARAALGSLVVHPDFASNPGRGATVLHLACTPAPGDGTATLCAALSELADPGTLLAVADLSTACAAPGVGAPGAVTFSGFEGCGRSGCGPIAVLRDPDDAGSAVTLPAAGYSLPVDYTFDLLPPGDPARVLGREVVDVSLTLDASPAELAPATAAADDCAALAAVMQRMAEEWSARPHVVSLKRIRVRGPEAPSAPNQNPAITGMTLAGIALPSAGGALPAFAPGVELELLPTLPAPFDLLRETWIRCDATGAPIEAVTEDWTFSWFSTAGELDVARTQSPGEPERFTTPGTGSAQLWAVVRDSRGGTAWVPGEVSVGP
jgi:hypothetical protein